MTYSVNRFVRNVSDSEVGRYLASNIARFLNLSVPYSTAVIILATEFWYYRECGFELE